MVSYVENFGELITKIPTKPLTVKMLGERNCCLGIGIPEAETGYRAAVLFKVWLATVPPCVGFAGWLLGGMDSKPLFGAFLFYFIHFQCHSNFALI
jgi:hypothetical protein